MYRHKPNIYDTLTAVPVYCGPLQLSVAMIDMFMKLLLALLLIENNGTYRHVGRTFILLLRTELGREETHGIFLYSVGYVSCFQSEIHSEGAKMNVTIC